MGDIQSTRKSEIYVLDNRIRLLELDLMSNRLEYEDLVDSCKDEKNEFQMIEKALKKEIDDLKVSLHTSDTMRLRLQADIKELRNSLTISEESLIAMAEDQSDMKEININLVSKVQVHDSARVNLIEKKSDIITAILASDLNNRFMDDNAEYVYISQLFDYIVTMLEEKYLY